MEDSFHPEACGRLALVLDLCTSAVFLAIAVGALDVLLLSFALGGLVQVVLHRRAVTLLGAWALAGLIGILAHPRGEVRLVRRSAEPAWVLLSLGALPFLILFLSAWSERRDLALLPGGAVLGWLGVALAGVGALLRAAAVAHLGRRFTARAVVQEGHALVQSGLYSWLRHPAYLGALLSGAGAALAFRSGVGLAAALTLLLPIRVRIRNEERLLAEHFGEAFADYRRRTGGLVPRNFQRIS